MLQEKIARMVYAAFANEMKMPALNAVFPYKNPDRTLGLNSKIQHFSQLDLPDPGKNIYPSELYFTPFSKQSGRAFSSTGHCGRYSGFCSLACRKLRSRLEMLGLSTNRQRLPVRLQ